MVISRAILSAAALLSLAEVVSADPAVNKATQNDIAFDKYGLTGKGVIVAILDRGLDYAHPDFRNADRDRTTRIKKMWDMSNTNPNLWPCDRGQPEPFQYTEDQINQALSTKVPLGERDAVGHGTVTTGLAAGNGRALWPSSAQWAGIAPEADLLIVKMISEGAQRHGVYPFEQPEEFAFQGCVTKALELVTQEAMTLGEPIVALIDSGTQWGPIDGNSDVSRKIDEVFGSKLPGRVYVSASGDEGKLNNHARAAYGREAAVFKFQFYEGCSAKAPPNVDLQAWYTGGVPATVTLTMDTATAVTAAPGNCSSKSIQVCNGECSNRSIQVCNYLPGRQEDDSLKSSGRDQVAVMSVKGYCGDGSITFQATQSGTGIVDVYGDLYETIHFTNNPTEGRLTDYSSTKSAIVVGCFNVRTDWTDIGNHPAFWGHQGNTNDLWTYSSGGPTRDGRSPPNGGVDITTPGGNAFAAYSPTSLLGDPTFCDEPIFCDIPLGYSRLIKDGKGLYGWHSAASASAPIAVGAVALLLQMNPKLTATQIRQIIHDSATSDDFTGATPDVNWGRGKLNLLDAADRVAKTLHTNPALSASTLTFASAHVNSTSPSQRVTFSNQGPASDALGITSIEAGGDFSVTGNTCATSLPAGGQCTIDIAFKPTGTGVSKGFLTIKDFNVNGPHKVELTGTGS